MTSLVVIIYSGTHIVPVPVVSYRLNPHNSTQPLYLPLPRLKPISGVSFVKNTVSGAMFCLSPSRLSKTVFRDMLQSNRCAVATKATAKGQNGCKQAACHGNIVNDSSSLRLCSSSWPITRSQGVDGLYTSRQCHRTADKSPLRAYGDKLHRQRRRVGTQKHNTAKAIRLSNSSLRSFAVPRLSVMRCARFSIAFSSAESESKPRTATYIVAPKRL